MKKSMILAAMAAVALTSCNNNDFVEDDITTGSDQLVEIRVGQSVQGIETKSGMQTRAAISTGDPVEATIIATDGDAPADWASFTPVLANTFTAGATEWSATAFANVATGTFVAGTATTVSLNPALYANPDAGATLTGVAPAGTVANGKVTFSTFDGQQDVMLAATTTKLTGSNIKTTPFALTFEHKTAQLRFRFAATNNEGNGAWSEAKDVIKVKSVTMKAAQVPNAVNLTTKAVEWTAVAELALANLTNNTLPLTYGTTAENNPDFIQIDKVAMVKPAGSVELAVVLTFNGTDKSYTITPKKTGGAALTTLEGKYHNISMTVKEPKTPEGLPVITATATVTEWVEGDEGFAEL